MWMLLTINVLSIKRRFETNWGMLLLSGQTEHLTQVSEFERDRVKSTADYVT